MFHCLQQYDIYNYAQRQYVISAGIKIFIRSFSALKVLLIKTCTISLQKLATFSTGTMDSVQISVTRTYTKRFVTIYALLED